MYKNISPLFHFLKKKKYSSVLFLTIGLGILIFFLATSKVLYNTGDIFFGKVPTLYNLKLAHFFFEKASYPLLGKPVLFAHYQLSRTYFIQGDLDSALHEAHNEIDMYPENTRTYYILGLTYGYMNEEEKAIDAFTKFIENNPATWAGRNDKAWLQFRAGDIDGALQTIEPVATSTDLHNAWVQNTYGTLLMNKNRLPEAYDAFKRAEKTISLMNETSWGSAYPGNDPRIYATGFRATKLSIESNLKILEQKNKSTSTVKK